MRIALRTHSKRALALIGTAVVAFALAVAMAMPPTSQAHDTAHCHHGDINPPGGWYNVYVGHFWSGGTHYNVYDHRLDGYYQHREYNVCG